MQRLYLLWIQMCLYTSIKEKKKKKIYSGKCAEVSSPDRRFMICHLFLSAKQLLTYKRTHESLPSNCTLLHNSLHLSVF